MQPLIGSPIILEEPKTIKSKTHSVASAPPPTNVTSKQTVTENVRQANSSTEGKIRYSFTSDRLTQLRRIVDDAVREHKTFTIKGGWNTIRNQFILRGWVEKYESSAVNPKQKSTKETTAQSLDEVCSNLPAKQDWESQTAYTLKCERTIMSRMLQNHSVDFYWNMRREPSDWHHRVNTHQIMNRFARSIFTSKEGLNLLLQQVHWHIQPGVSVVNFPRCYTLGYPEHVIGFTEDFRMTACISLLKWFINKYEDEDEYSIRSPEGKVPLTAMQFALDRCGDYIAMRKHMDIDREPVKVWGHEWDQFLSHFYLIVHENELFLESHEFTIPLLNATARTTLNELETYWPMIHSDGMKNIWILKPGNKCRGRGIQLVKRIEDVAKIVHLKLKYVVQKYIERPLLIYQTKFDIRQWFLISSVQPLTIWMYRECYLRFSTQIFNLENFHESLHLTNHAVQCKYSNVLQRNQELPDQNMWSTHSFKDYLGKIGQPSKWEDVVYPGMRENIVGVMLACQETLDRRPNTFELYGADFIIGEDFKPWLLEINSSPDLSSSTDVTGQMCPQVLQDLIKVIIDRRRNLSSETGLFDMVYRQTLPRAVAYFGVNLTVQGNKIAKNKKYRGKPQKENKPVPKNAKIITAKLIPSDVVSACIPKMISPDLYKGQVLGELIEGLHQSIYPTYLGCEFVPASPAQPKKKSGAVKHERVSNTECGSPKNETNHTNFVNRKSNVRENSKLMEIGYSKPRSMFIKSAYFDLLHEWKLKNKFTTSSNHSFSKNKRAWEKDVSSIPKNKQFLSKLNIHNLNGSNLAANKKYLQAHRHCLSSINLSLSLPQLHKIEPQFPFDLSGAKTSMEDKSRSAKNIRLNNNEG